MRTAAIAAAVTSLMPSGQGSQRIRGDRDTLSFHERNTRQRCNGLRSSGCKTDHYWCGRQSFGLLRSDRAPLPRIWIVARLSSQSTRLLFCARALCPRTESSARFANILTFGCAPGANPRGGVLNGPRLAHVGLRSPAAGRSKSFHRCSAHGSSFLETHAGSAEFLLAPELREQSAAVSASSPPRDGIRVQPACVFLQGGWREGIRGPHCGRESKQIVKKVHQESNSGPGVPPRTARRVAKST